MKYKTKIITALFVLPICANIALGQSVQPIGNGQSADRVVDLEEMKVTGVQPPPYQVLSSTATNIPAPLVEIPTTLNVLSADFLKGISARRLEDALVYVPGVANDSGTTGGAHSSYNIRGFSTQTSSSRGTFIDGFQINRRAYVPDLSLYEQVDILKGASGLLFGTARPGGVVNYVSKRPQAEPSIDLEASFGSYNLRRASLDATGTVASDKSLLYRLIVTGQTANQTAHGQNNDASYDDRFIVAPSIRWFTPGAGKLDISFQYYWHDQIFDPGIKRINGEIRYNSLPYVSPFNNYDREHSIGVIEFTQPLGDNWSLFIGGTLQYTDTDLFLDVAAAGPLTGGLLQRTSQDFYSTIHQNQLRAELRGAFHTGDQFKHNLTVGADKFSAETDTQSFVANSANAVDPFNPTFVAPPSVRPASLDFLNPEDEFGLFIQDYIEVGQYLKVFGGLRYIDFESAFESRPGFTFNQSTEGTATDFTLGSIYNHSEPLNPFVAYSTSTEPQSGVVVGGEKVDFREADQLEIGIKSEWLGGKFGTSLSLFEINQTNKAESDSANPGFVVLIGDERVRGLELETVGNLTEQLSVFAGYSYLDAEITRSATAAIVGTQSANTPKHKASAYLVYTFTEGPLVGLSANLGIIRVVDRQGDNVNSYQLPNYTRWDCGLAYIRDYWRISLNVENLADRDYVSGAAGNFAGGQRITQGAKRSFTLSAGYTF